MITRQVRPILAPKVNSMPYRKFSNLGEKFNSDLSGKVMKDVIDFDLHDRECSCDKRLLCHNQTCAGLMGIAAKVW